MKTEISENVVVINHHDVHNLVEDDKLGFLNEDHQISSSKARAW